MTTSDTQGDLTCNPETDNHTSNRNEAVTHTSNRKFEQKILSHWTTPVIVPTINPGIYQRVAPIVLAPQMLLMPVMKEFDTDMVLGGAWVNRNTWQGIRTGPGGSTPGYILYAVRVVEDPYLVLIGIVPTSPPCGLNASQQVANKRKPTSLR